MDHSFRDCRTRRAPAGLIWILVLLLPASVSAADRAAAIRAMEDPDNPLVQMQTARGEMYLELFPDAAPRTVEQFLARLEPTDDGDAYYDGFTFARVLRNTLIQTGTSALRGDGSSAGPSPSLTPHEISARRLNLAEQQMVDASGELHPWLNIADRSGFAETVLLPLYREMNIEGPGELRNRQQEVVARLQEMNLQQAYEQLGYRYDDSLPSLAPRRGSLVMIAAGARGSTPGFFITLRDTPWLAGRYTVIGRVVDGMPVAREIGSSADDQSPAGIDRMRRIEADGETIPFPRSGAIPENL